MIVPILLLILAVLGAPLFAIIATSATPPRPSEVAVGISTALVAPLVGIVLMVPGYATALFGSLIRSLQASAKAPTRDPDE